MYTPLKVFPKQKLKFKNKLQIILDLQKSTSIKYIKIE